MSDESTQQPTPPDENRPTLAELREMVEKFPYFPMPAMELLKHHTEALDHQAAERLKLHVALTTAHRQTIFANFSPIGETLGTLYPPEKAAAKPSTSNAIDTFFATYGSTDDNETRLLEKMIFNPVPDYSEVLAREAAAEAPSQAQTPPTSNPQADSPTATDEPAAAPTTPKPTSAPVRRQESDESLLSESLAKIFIRQGRYERAHEIISNLSLNYPKKSIYFADQLRFLQKLIQIQQAQQNNEPIKLQ